MFLQMLSKLFQKSFLWYLRPYFTKYSPLTFNSPYFNPPIHFFQINCTLSTSYLMLFSKNGIPNSDAQPLNSENSEFTPLVTPTLDLPVSGQSKVEPKIASSKKETIQKSGPNEPPLSYPHPYPPIDPREIEERFISGSGPGGQKINKRHNCVVLRHIPTNITVQVPF